MFEDYGEISNSLKHLLSSLKEDNYTHYVVTVGRQVYLTLLENALKEYKNNLTFRSTASKDYVK